MSEGWGGAGRPDFEVGEPCWHCGCVLFVKLCWFGEL